MKDYQDKLLEKIESAITSHNSHLTRRKVEMVVRKDMGNTGSFYAQPETTFDVILSGKYNVQYSYATISLSAKTSVPLEVSIDFEQSPQRFDEIEAYILRVVKVWVQNEMRFNGQKSIS